MPQYTEPGDIAILTPRTYTVRIGVEAGVTLHAMLGPLLAHESFLGGESEVINAIAA